MSMTDRRGDSPFFIIVRIVFSLIGAGVGIALLFTAGDLYGKPSGAFVRHREPVQSPRLAATGKLQETGKGEFPPLCTVAHERLERCGKSSCWKPYETFRYSRAQIGFNSYARPDLNLSAGFQYEPWLPAAEIVDGPRAEAWKTYARDHNLGFVESNFGILQDRIVQTCVADGTRVHVQGCLSSTRSDTVDACAGEEVYGITVNGEREAVIDDAADMLARYLGGAAVAFFVVALCWLQPRRPIATGLEDRAAAHRRGLGAAWGILALVPLLGFSVLLMHGSHPPSTWSTGRGGFVFAISAFLVWLLFALNRWLERRRTLFALAPVLATPRSPLAEASGTAELHVRARKRGDGLRAFIGDDPVAFTQLHIKEVYKAGKNATTVDRGIFTPSEELEVVDESGDGVLHLGNAILDVELRRVTLPALSPRYAERNVFPERHPNHVHFIVEERVIKDGEQLYVLGDVSKLSMKAETQGYRAVRGSPTLGGKDNAPVLVHSGDERGLISLLTRDARAANSFAVVAAVMCSAIGAALLALARL